MASKKVDGYEERALAYLNGNEDEDVDALWRGLKRKQMFSLARRVIGKRRVSCPDVGVLRQQEALCTSKDPDLPEHSKHDLALRLLGSLESATSNEELGIAGGIWKRKWYFSAQPDDLEESRRMYERGSEDREDTSYYCAINHAFVLDLMAADGQEGSGALRDRADAIRKTVVAGLEKVAARTAWQSASLAEAAFGLGQFDIAKAALQEYAAGRETWELDTTERQLVRLLHLRQGASWSGDATKIAAARATVAVLGGPAAADTSSALIGRVGLALSGGGFRASLYHLGVLRRLAELDLLRRVEVLSCVSGGSIAGTLYYLLLKNELEATGRPKPLSREDYLRVVDDTRAKLVEFIKTNPRTRVMSSIRSNLKAAFSKTYSRSDRLAELLNRELYGPLLGKPAETPPFMHELKIRPSDVPFEAADDFKPKIENWKRQDKVPMLVLNATTLNTGHLWQFTAASMGEPPFAIPEVDMVPRLRRFHYRPELPSRRVTVGHAVGASACVPGLFEPLTLAETYPGTKSFHAVRLVDGGVIDNLGTMSLLEQDITFVIVSDASGQMDFQSAADGGIFGPLVRSNSVMMSRLRSAGYSDLEYRRRVGQLRGGAFMHLRADLDVDPIDWVSCEDPYKLEDSARRRAESGSLTKHGVRKDIQAVLSSMRTDLDTFTIAEVEALYTAGFLQTRYAFSRTEMARLGLASPPDEQAQPYERAMKSVHGHNASALEKHLSIGSRQVGRLLSYRKRIFYGSGVVALVILALVGYLVWTHRHASVISVGGLAMIVAGSILAILLGPVTTGMLFARSTVERWTLTAGATIVTALIAKLYLCFGEPEVLAEGERVDREVRGASDESSS